MELSGTTFVLEIVNFVILVWILTRFLYRPVLNVIATRKAAIDKTLADAEAARNDAAELRVRYESRVEEWNVERERKLGELSAEIDATRKERLAALDAELAREREKAAASAARREQDARIALEQQALELGARYAAEVLKVAAAPELEARLIAHAIEELRSLPKEQVALLDDAGKVDAITVTSAFTLDPRQSETLTNALRETLRIECPVDFAVDAKLLAGVEIAVGARVLAFNLRDELAGFAALAREH